MFRRLLSLNLSIVTSLLLLLSIVGCGGDSQQREIVIGTISPLTGQAALYGQKLTNAVDLAVKEMNDQGGINGRSIRTVHEDSQIDPEKAVSAAEKLISLDRASVIIGAVASSATLAVAPIAERNQTILITPISSAEPISRAGDYVFRIAPSDGLLGKEAGKWLHEEGLLNVAVVYINNDYGTGIHRAFDEEFTALGGTIVLASGYNAENTDFRTILTRIAAKTQPQALFVAGYIDDSAQIIRQSRELGLTIPVLGTDPLHDPRIFELVSAETLEGVRFLDVSNYSGDAFQSFASAFKEASNIDADIIAAQSYDAAKVVLMAMQRNPKPSPADLSSVSFEGASGLLSFDENGDATGKAFDRFTIQAGEYIVSP